MITFLICVVLLIVGYMTYGKFVDKVFAPDDRPTPAIALEDGVDYVPMDNKKIFLIQLLNIAGLGPITGALQGALWGPVVYFWIVLGTILAGGVHDYMTGMLSMRNSGGSISEIVGRYLGTGMKKQTEQEMAVLYLADRHSALLLPGNPAPDRQAHRKGLSLLRRLPDYHGGWRWRGPHHQGISSS